ELVLHFVPRKRQALAVLVVQRGLLERDPYVDVHCSWLAKLLQNVQVDGDWGVGDHVKEALGELNVAVLDRRLIGVSRVEPEFPLVGDGLIDASDSFLGAALYSALYHDGGRRKPNQLLTN